MPGLVESIEVREPVYIPRRFSFNGYLSGENPFEIHLDATKPVTIYPAMCMSYESMFDDCLARSIVVPELTSNNLNTSARRMFCNDGLLSSFETPRGFWSRLSDCNGMLSGCTSLSSIDMSEEDGGALSGLKNMSNMFDKCTNLSSIEFPAGSGTQLTTTIIAGGFMNCTNLQKLVFPAGFGGRVSYLRR